MSRLEFRSRVELPRPRAAWGMVGVASTALWITGQLMLPVMAIQLVGFVLSYARRERPFAWQRNALALNLAMGAISATTAAVAFQGQPTTVALAHFAALMQALQLLDARPRKSEFLLVALALFQVILAANLTDSLMFPLLLVVFVVTTTWTLLIHTLRSEAIEAGEGGSAARAITPGLLRTTVVASVCSIVLAAVLFVMLPRMRSHMVEGGLGASQAVAGFSERVELGTLGRIRQDDRVVLRVETLRGDPPDPAGAYWRGLAFDTFDGRDWSITPTHRTAPGGSPKFGVVVDARARAKSDATVQQIVREPVAAGVLFASGHPRRIAGPLDHLEMDVNGGLYAPGRENERIRYTVESDRTQPPDAALAGDRAAIGRVAIPRSERFTALPAFDPAIASLARSIVGDLPDDARRVRAIERYLRDNGRYTDTPPALGDAGRSPIEDFLTDGLAGHCEYFASAMVVLTRSVGIPSRLVNGFAGGRANPLGGFVELTRSDAHAWVEVHYEQAGWVRYDPTPPDLRLRAALPLSLSERAAQLASVVELWWFQRVVDFDSSDQIQAMRSAWGAWQGVRSAATRPRERAQPRALDGIGASDALPWFEIGLAGIALALAIRLVVRQRRRGAAASRIPPGYAKALRWLARRGLVRRRASPAREFAAEVRARLGSEAGDAFDRITERYLSQRFGGQRRRETGRREGDADLAAMRRSARA